MRRFVRLNSVENLGYKRFPIQGEVHATGPRVKFRPPQALLDVRLRRMDRSMAPPLRRMDRSMPPPPPQVKLLPERFSRHQNEVFYFLNSSQDTWSESSGYSLGITRKKLHRALWITECLCLCGHFIFWNAQSLS
jgi:hypothetical protein